MKLEKLERRQLLSAALINNFGDIVLPSGSVSTTIDLNAHISSNVVKFETVVGNFEVALTQKITPATVANFLNYVNSGRYNNSIVHRVVPGFVIQGGGFDSSGNSIPTDTPVNNEFRRGVTRNLRGTIAMAKTSDPNSATDQWFINLADNRRSLDNTANSGGFTTFGTIIAGGLGVVDNIASLPTVDGSSLNPANPEAVSAFSPSGGSNSFPVLNAAAPVAPANTVAINSVTLDQSFIYSITSDNTALVTPVINGNSLTLNYASNNIGTAHIKIKATGPDHTIVTSSFAVSLTGNSIVVGTAAARSLTFTAANGSLNTVAIRGGTAAVTFDQSVQVINSHGRAIVTTTGVNVTDISISNTATAAPALVIATRGGAGLLSIPSIADSAKVYSIVAPRVQLTGTLNVGGITSLVLGGVTDSTLNIGNLGATPTASLSLGQVTSSSLNAGVYLRSLAVTSWTGTAGGTDAGSINVPGIVSLVSRGDFSPTLALSNANAFAASLGAARIIGQLGGNWNTNSLILSVSAKSLASNFAAAVNGLVRSFVVAGDWNNNLSCTGLGSLSVGGNILGGAIQSSGVFSATLNRIGSIVARGFIANATITAVGSIGAVSGLALTNSTIFAGVDPNQVTAGQLPTSAGQFIAPSTIGVVRLLGRVGATFSDSLIAATTVRSVNLGSGVQTTTANPEGVVGQNLFSIVGVLPNGRLRLGRAQLVSEGALQTYLSVSQTNLGNLTIAVV